MTVIEYCCEIHSANNHKRNKQTEKETMVAGACHSLYSTEQPTNPFGDEKPSDLSKGYMMVDYAPCMGCMLMTCPNHVPRIFSNAWALNQSQLD